MDLLWAYTTYAMCRSRLEASDFVSVMSGVPQGTVLGPLMFLLYNINDINENLTSQIRLLADDFTLYNPIISLYIQKIHSIF